MPVVIEVRAQDRVRRVVFAGGDPRQGVRIHRQWDFRDDRYVLNLSF